MTTTMTMEDKLYSMTGSMLIKKADELGVKVACNKTRTALKEAKSGVIARIIAADTFVAEPEQEAVVEEPTASEVTTEEPAVETKPVKKVRKVKAVVSDEVITTFIDDLKSNVVAQGLELKTWDKMKNLYAIKKDGKAVLECYVGKKNYRLNTKVAFLPEGIDFTTIKNYYLPTCVKGIAFTDTMVFDIIKSLN